VEVVDADILQFARGAAAGKRLSQNDRIGGNTAEMDMVATLDNLHGLVSRNKFDWFHKFMFILVLSIIYSLSCQMGSMEKGLT
jgi:hypothetical protein